jgi:hypothetical protein
MLNLTASSIVSQSSIYNIASFTPSVPTEPNRQAILSVDSFKNGLINIDSFNRVERMPEPQYANWYTGFAFTAAPGQGLYTGNIKFILGAHIENRVTNSLDTITGVGNATTPFTLNSTQATTLQEGVRYNIATINGSGPEFKTDIRDLSYYFMSIDVVQNMIYLGKNIRGNEIILKQSPCKRTGDYFGSLSFSCFQSNTQEVTLVCRIGTPYSSLPYTTIRAVDSNNFLASKGSDGRYGFIVTGKDRGPSNFMTPGGYSDSRIMLMHGPCAYARNLQIGSRSNNDQFVLCTNENLYFWQGAGNGGTTNPPPSVEDPTPPQPGDKTVISNVGGVELSYDNAGQYKDYLKINDKLVGINFDRRVLNVPLVNRIDYLRSGWAPVAAVDDPRLSGQALQLGTNNTNPKAIIWRNITNNHITFWRMSVLGGDNYSIPSGSWFYSSADGDLSPTSTKYHTVETIVNLDINGDGSVGSPQPPTPPAPNTANISTVGDVVLSYNTSGINKDLLRVANNYIKDQYGNDINYFQYINSGYEAVGAASINGINYLAWKTPSNGIPFSAGSVEVVADRPLFSNDRSQVTDAGTVTSIPIKFTVPVTEFSLANNILIFRNGLIAPALKSVASLSGSGMSYTLTIPSGTSTNGVYEIRILNYNRTSGLYITGTVNGQPVTMKQNASIYWGKGVGSASTNSPTAKSLTLWKMSSTWTFDSVSAINAPLSPEYYQTESNFIIDFDKDGIVGNPNNSVQPPPQLATIENSGNTILSYDQNDHLRANGTLIILDSSPVKRINPSWDHLVAENISGTNYLLSRSKATGGCRIVRFDTNWRSVSTDPIVSPNTEEFFSTEILFNTDIDNNGLIGKPLSPVILKTMRTTPSLNLVLSYDRQGSESGLLKLNGSLVKDFNNNNVNVTEYRLAKWRPIAVGVVNGVNTIVWRQTDNKYLHFWRLDNSWKQVSSDGYFAPNSVGLYGAEVTFGIDFNGDGKIGSPRTTTQPPTSPALTNIENSGSVTLAYNRDNILTANGTIVKINNIPLKRTGTDWTYLAAENINGTNTILQQLRTNGYLNFLEFDNNWNSIANSGWYAPGSADFYAIELMFQKDIDNNGNTGPILSLTSNFEETLQAFGNQTLNLSVSLNTNLSQSDTTIRYEWEYDTGSGWTDWTLPQTDTFKSSSISVVFLPTYTTLKVRCKVTVLFAPDSLALDVFGGNFELMSKELVATKKAETNYVVVRSPVPFTFTYDRGSSFNLDTIPKYIQDSIAMISGGDLPSDYLTSIPSSWTPLCGPLETDNCATYRQAQNNGVYGTRLLKSGLTYTIYPKTLSFRPFLIDFENLS